MIGYELALLIGRPTRLWPPRRAKFYRSPAVGLRLSRCEGRVRLELVMVGPVVCDLMVFGAALRRLGGLNGGGGWNGLELKCWRAKNRRVR